MLREQNENYLTAGGEKKLLARKYFQLVYGSRLYECECVCNHNNNVRLSGQNKATQKHTRSIFKGEGERARVEEKKAFCCHLFISFSFHSLARSFSEKLLV